MEEPTSFPWFTTIAVVTAVLMAVYHYFKEYFVDPYDNDNYRLPPVPRRGYPIIGHAAFLQPSPCTVFKEWKAKVGDVFRIYLGSQRYIVFAGYEPLKESFLKKGDIFAENPPLLITKLSHSNAQGKILGLQSPEWKEHRTVTVNILRSFGMGKNAVASKISAQVEGYINAICKLKGEPTDLHVLTNAAISNVICAMLVGKPFEYDDEFFVHLIELCSDKLQLLRDASILNSFPILMYLPGDLFGLKKMVNTFLDLQSKFSDHFIKKFRNNYEDTSKDNFVKAYLREIMKKRNAGVETALDEDALICLMDDLFAGGTETTSTTVLWSIVYAMNYPDAHKKVYDEIIEVVGKDRRPTLDDRPKMTYLNAYISEVLRLGSIGPLGVPHLCSQTTTISGYTIPKGTVVIPDIDAILHDKETWGDPMVFRPERFLDEEGNLSLPDQYVPFSIGRRSCLGKALGYMELFLFISAIFQRFDFKPEVPNKPPSMDPVFGLTHTPKRFRLRIVERV